MENEVRKEKSLTFWVVMLVVLFVAVFGIFAMLRMALPQEFAAQNQPPAVVEEEQLPAPKFCTFCGDELPEGFEWGRFCPYCGKNIDN